MKTLLILIFLNTIYLYSQDKYGYFDYDSIKKTIPEFEQIENEKVEVYSKYMDTLKNMELEFSKYLYTISSHNVDSRKIIQYNDTLNLIHDRISKYEEYANLKYNQFEIEQDNRIKKIASIYLDEFCVKNGIKVISEKNAILYCEGCIDYTLQFKTYLKSKHL